MFEILETDSIKSLCSLALDYFAYALNNGTVGVYREKKRVWRIKSKNSIICIIGFDINGDGLPELITGWSSGKVDARNIETGEVIFKDNFTQSIAAIIISDFNMDGQDELIICSINGEVRGYNLTLTQERPSLVTVNYEQETIRDLMKRKQNLLFELRNYENSNSLTESSMTKIYSKASIQDDQFGAIPANTQIKSNLVLNLDDDKVSIKFEKIFKHVSFYSILLQPSVQLFLQTTNETIIRFVVIFAEGIFNGESYVVHPLESEVSGSINIPLWPPKDIPIDLHIKSMVGYQGSHHFHVFELTRYLPRFSMYALLKSIPESNLPKGMVSFQLNQSVKKVF